MNNSIKFFYQHVCTTTKSEKIWMIIDKEHHKGRDIFNDGNIYCIAIFI